VSTWDLVVTFEWPTLGQSGSWEKLLREVVDPLHRENVIVSGVRLELRDES